MNPKIVVEGLGHASVTLTLNAYSHVLPTMREEAAGRLVALTTGNRKAHDAATGGLGAADATQRPQRGR